MSLDLSQGDLGYVPVSKLDARLQKMKLLCLYVNLIKTLFFLMPISPSS